MSPAPKVRWLELELEVPNAVADEVAATLFEVGASGVQLIGDVDDPMHGVEESLPDAPPPRTAEHRGCTLLVVTFEGLETHEPALEAVRDAVGAHDTAVAGDSLRWRWRDDSDWAERWKAYFEPLPIGERLWIVPTWRSDFTPPAGAMVLHMDPGMAFGTGQHATTAGCLLALMESTLLAGAARPDFSILDVGCGSGVLAIACAKLGVRRATAIDIDELAIEATRENARLNGVAPAITASTTPLAEVTGTFDLVIGNILAVTLEELAPELVRVLAPGGRMLLSGILEEQVEHLVARFDAVARGAGRGAAKLTLHTARGDWATLVLELAR